jgi:hypothetical protein
MTMIMNQVAEKKKTNYSIFRADIFSPGRADIFRRADIFSGRHISGTT